MQSQNRLLDDLTAFATSLGAAASGVKTEMDDAVRARLERVAGDLNLVSREEHEVLKEMLLLALNRIEALEAAQAAPLKHSG